MTKQVWPRVQALVVCDAVEASAEETDVFHLEGVRSAIEVASFPYVRPRLCVYLQMSAHQGEASCRLEIHRPGTDDVISQTPPRMVPFQGPLTVRHVVFRFRNCSFPEPGVYYVQCLCGSKLIGERPLRLLEEGVSNGEPRS